MSVLESVIGGVVGQVFGGQRGGAMAPLVKALLLLLLEKGAGGLMGQGGAPHPVGPEPGRPPAPDGGDIGGFGQYRGGRVPQPDVQPADAADSSLPPGDFSDLSGMLDGLGDTPATGNVSHETQSGLDALADRFRGVGLDPVMDSWIVPGANHPVTPEKLAQALGPGTINTLVRQTGLDRALLLSQLAQALPAVIDALTPKERSLNDNDGR